VRTLSSPAIEVEAATRSPFVQTLPPQAPELAEVSEPSRAPPLLIGLPGGLYDDPGEVILTGGFFRTRVAPLVERAAPLLANKWARIGGGVAIGVVVVVIATWGGTPAPAPATVVPSPVSIVTLPPTPKDDPVPSPPAVVPSLPPKPAPVAAPAPAVASAPVAAPAAAPRETPPPTETEPAPTTAAPSPVGGRVEDRADDGTDRSASKGERRPTRGSGAESKRRVPLLD
jgi:hypothetical protein